MGFQIRWDKTQILNHLGRMAGEINNPFNDGFTTWEIKKDLLDIQFALDEMLNQMPTYAGEAAHKEELAKQQTWKVLNEKTNSR
jgi:hypothetical protein